MVPSNEQSLKQAIEKMLKTYHLERKILEMKLVSSWGSVTGKMVSRHTKQIYISKKKLFVKIDSPAVKNELIYNRQNIIDILNKEAGEEVIKEIVFL